jgi:hypothetical protein
MKRGVSMVVALAAVACGNPAIDQRIELLGEENPNVEPSEFHRPGQPCVLCHSAYEGADPPISIGGTIFADTEDTLPVENVEVVLTDAVGEQRVKSTNCIGNFFLTEEEWMPQYPVAAEIRYPLYDDTGSVVENADGVPERRQKTMDSFISRDGSCATCHTLDGRELNSTGWIYCLAPGDVNPFPPVADTCPGEAP